MTMGGAVDGGYGEKFGDGSLFGAASSPLGLSGPGWFVSGEKEAVDGIPSLL
jgi:hypothetical protein